MGLSASVRLSALVRAAERDLGAKGGPKTSLGIADDAHDVPNPYDEDIQNQLAAKSTANKNRSENNKTNNPQRKQG